LRVRSTGYDEIKKSARSGIPGPESAAIVLEKMFKKDVLADVSSG